jgi:hypothetical protein
MRWSSVGRFFELVARIGADPAESKEERVRRLIVCTTLVFGAPVSFTMAVAFAALGSPLGSAVMFVGAAFWSGELLLFAVLRRGLNSFALAGQLLIVLLTFVAVVSLGGPIHSGGLILMGLMAPFHALVFPPPRRAAWLLVAYIISFVVSASLADRVPWALPLSPLANLVMFAVTLAVVSVFVFLTLFFFVRERDRALGL